MTLEWIDPPPNRADLARAYVAAKVAELRTRPGVWARVEIGIQESWSMAAAWETAEVEMKSDLEPYGGEAQRTVHGPVRFDLYARAPKEA